MCEVRAACAVLAVLMCQSPVLVPIVHVNVVLHTCIQCRHINAYNNMESDIIDICCIISTAMLCTYICISVIVSTFIYMYIIVHS